jgi:hypothetical protein
LLAPRRKSHYVNEEARTFKSRYPDRPVIPLIAGGEPSDLDKECFPPAVRFAATNDGAITKTPSDVLAADLREKGDGFNLAMAKVVARLLGLAPDDVYRRAERERRRQARLRAAIAVVVVALVVAAGGFYWRWHQEAAKVAAIDSLVAKYSVATEANAGPGAKQSLTAAITAIAEGAAVDPRDAKALALLKAGRPDEAVPLMKAVAEDKARRADKNARDAAADYRHLAAIAAITDPKQAREYYAEAARRDPSDIDGMFRNGWFQEDAGELTAASGCLLGSHWPRRHPVSAWRPDRGTR